MLLTKVVHRFFLFVLSSVAWLAAGIFFIGGSSIIDLVHFLALPLVFSWLIVFRPQIAKKNIVPYLVLTILISLLAASYLIAFAKSIPHIKINWLELPLAVYFLLSVYTIVWLLDKTVNQFLSFILKLKNYYAKNAIKGVVRTGLMIFVIVPYLAAVFTTHWLKFSGADIPQNLTGMQYQRLCFNGSDGTKLDGLFIAAATGLSDSTVIISPGRSPTKNLFLAYAGILNNNGYNVLLFDSRGNGDSGGHKYSFAINEANDIICAIDYLKIRYAAWSGHIFGLGINEGAAALIAAAGADYRLDAAVIDNASGYEASLPDGLGDYLPKWLDKTLSKIIKTVISLDIGRTGWGTEKIEQDISQISPRPVLFTNGLKTNKSDRRRTIELYSKAKEPKMLWISPLPAEPRQNIGIEMEYFKSILDIFNSAKINHASSRLKQKKAG